MKVYVVGEGVYSDFHTEAVFSSKELAENYVSKFGGDYVIDEYELDAPSLIPDGFKYYRVEMDRDGSSEVCLTGPSTAERMSSTQHHVIWDNWNKREKLIVDTMAQCVEDAVKIANEIRSRELALGTWDKSILEYKEFYSKRLTQK